MDTILVTGGLGRIGRALSRQLRGTYRTRSFDLRPSPEADENAIGNITDIPTLVEAMQGAQAVVHLAAIPGEAPFDLLLDANIRGTWCVYEAARQANVAKIVFASTNHVTGMWEKAGVFTTPDMPIRPDSLYAVSKAAGEAVARYYADAYGIASVCLRIGGVGEEDRPDGLRDLWLWISHRDIAQLVDKAIRADVLFAILNATSGHPKVYGDLSTAKALLGYEPQDNAEEWLDRFSPEIQERYNQIAWRRLTHAEMLYEWVRLRA